MFLRSRLVLGAIGLSLALLPATRSAPAPEPQAVGPSAPSTEAPSAHSVPADGTIRAEDGSWVPASFYERGPGPRGTAAPRREGRRIPGSFIVALAPGLDPREAGPQIAAEYGGEVAFVYDEVIGGFAFQGPDDARARMADDPRIREVEPDYEAHLADHAVPVERVAIRAPGAWGLTRGTGAVVAIIDTGVNAAHPQLAGRILGRDGSCVGESGLLAGTDTRGHGTAVAGHAFGHYGTFPDAKGYSVKVFEDGKSSTSYSKVICGINVVKGLAAGAVVHSANLSLVGSSSSSSLQRAVRELRDSGVTVVAAAGNSGGKVQYPAAYPEAVAVSALNQSNTELATFSSRGPEIDLAAPGQTLTTLLLNTCCGTGAGTSYAAPQVAAAAAAMKTVEAATSNDQVVARLQMTGLCPPGASSALNEDGGDCNGPARSGDTDGMTEPALNIEGAVKGFDALPIATLIDPIDGATVRDAEVSAIRISVRDDDTAAGGLEVSVKVGSSGTTRAASYDPSGPCPADGTCYVSPWPTGLPEGPVPILVQVTEPGNGSVAISAEVLVDNVDDPPSVAWRRPGPGATVGSPVELQVTAADDRGVHSVKVFAGTAEVAELAPSGSVYSGSLSLPEGTHTLTAVASDGMHSSAAEQSFTVSDALFAETFDTVGAWPAGWKSDSKSSAWHITTTCASEASSPPVAYFGSSTDCFFGASKGGYLYSPVLTGLPTDGGLLLVFDSKERVGSCSGCDYHRRYVEVDYGKGWKLLSYKHAGTDPGTGVWEQRRFAFPACAGKVQVRFRFDPKTSKDNSHFGWAVDNVALLRTSEPLPCA